MNKLLNKIVWPVIVMPAVYLVRVWNQIAGQIALHFDLKGDAGRSGNKTELMIMAATGLFFAIPGNYMPGMKPGYFAYYSYDYTCTYSRRIFIPPVQIKQQ